jgi:branched-chain amino acid transport system ATP-binding protein
VADWGYVLETGRLALGGAPEALWGDARIRDAYLGGGQAKETA